MATSDPSVIIAGKGSAGRKESALHHLMGILGSGAFVLFRHCDRVLLRKRYLDPRARVYLKVMVVVRMEFLHNGGAVRGELQRGWFATQERTHLAIQPSMVTIQMFKERKLATKSRRTGDDQAVRARAAVA